jgi:FixJ family two-component response regulator
MCEDRVSANKPTIYVVDDDPSVRRGFGRLLRFAGFATQTFASAEEFLGTQLRDHACVIADVRMPGMTGIDLQKRLRVMDSVLPVIAVSAEDDPATRQQAHALGASAYFRKPVDGQALLDAITWALAETEQNNKGSSQGGEDEPESMA